MALEMLIIYEILYSENNDVMEDTSILYNSY